MLAIVIGTSKFLFNTVLISSSGEPVAFKILLKFFVEFPSSKMKLSVLSVMKKEGYISNFTSTINDNKSLTKVDLKYDSERNSALKGLTRVSTPGLRSYSKKDEIPMYMGGLAISVISTSKGVMTGKEAFKSNLGGEIICYIW